MQAFILTLHVVVCVVLIVIVLLQSGKEGMGVIFGGGSSSLFGSSGAGGLLTKVTAVAATLFIVTSLSYTYLTRERHVEELSIMDSAVERQLQDKGATEAGTPEEAKAPDEKQGIQVDTGESSEAAPSGIQLDGASESGGQDAAQTKTGATTSDTTGAATSDSQ